MTPLSDLERARLVELRAERALRRLSPTEEKELQRLSAQSGEPDDGGFERAAAVVQLAAGARLEPLPRGLSNRLMRDADEWLAAQARAGAAPAGRGARRDLPPSWFAYGGWLAAAACAIAAVGLLLINVDSEEGPAVIAATPADVVPAEGGMPGEAGTRAPPREESLAARLADAPPARDREPEATRDVAPDAARERAALLAASRFTLRRNWTAGNDPLGRGVEGDVVWDARTQSGYLRFTGLRGNNPGREQYQLWIFDAGRDDRFPVDGGVFDVTPDGEVVIPIRAALRVDRPVMFAVTVERPGGVVVSDRSRIVVLARVT